MINPVFKNLTVVKHPVIDRDLTYLRDKNTNTDTFRRVLERVSIILAYHALKPLHTKPVTVETPIKKTTGYELSESVVVIPILRAGLGMVDSVIRFIPDAKIGHLGMYRNEITKKPVDYYSNLPNGIEDAFVLLVDPMLATGGSACDALTFLKSHGASNIQFMCLIAAPEGVGRVERKFPEVSIVTAALDDHLNSDAFIVPGLGDAGDRIFGTE